MSQVTTYTVKSKQDGFVWVFKYNLNGSFNSFQLLDSELSNKQIVWLFSGSNFPATEELMKSVWMAKSMNGHFEIIKAAPILDFETLWELYGHKAKKVESEKCFKKLYEGDRIKCFLAIPGYNKYLARKGTGKALLSTFINQRYFEDEWHKA